ncbi:MAG: Nif3-like dinuclear metal center hexameric protein [Succinivibrionaceae bacterium]|nr:Nif3-like dinuclear metal center hexameric protein [Succinivibrionaceae bacterium]
MRNRELAAYLDRLLDVRAFRDASHNGLQVEGRAEIAKIATAVTASQAAIEAAADEGADALIVHHGLLWGHGMPQVEGPLRERLWALLSANLNLLAYHLPLDAHLAAGNNRCLCDLLGIASPAYLREGDPSSIALVGRLERPRSVAWVAHTLSEALEARVNIIGTSDPNAEIESAAVCSGSGSFAIEGPAPAFDALVTGDVSEQAYHLARETGTVVFAVGHDASEEGGVEALGCHLAEEFGLEHVHLHCPTEAESLIYDARA